MSQSINLGRFCQRNKHLEEGGELAEQKKKNKTLKVFGMEVFNIQYFQKCH